MGPRFQERRRLRDNLSENTNPVKHLQRIIINYRRGTMEVTIQCSYDMNPTSSYDVKCTDAPVSTLIYGDMYISMYLLCEPDIKL